MQQLAKKIKYGKASVLSGGLHSLIVAHPGRIGYWRVGIPPSGPMDDYSFNIGNQIIGNNEQNTAGLEITYAGPIIQFDTDTKICLSGAKIKNANINNTTDITNDWFKPIEICKGDILDLIGSNISNTLAGCRTYLCVQNGGFLIDDYLGSKTSFVMGKFGGINNEGSVLTDSHILEYSNGDGQEVINYAPVLTADYIQIMESTHDEIVWEIGVLSGPQSSPDYLTSNDVKLLYATEYEVSHNASRLGIRLQAKDKNMKFEWSRPDGGEGGSHPSNLIDNPYPIGSVNFTGDYPVILTVDGPSLGGFVCPITIASTELWKAGQMKPGDKVRFKLIDLKSVITKKQTVSKKQNISISNDYEAYEDSVTEPVVYKIDENLSKNQPKVQYRMGGDKYLLIDYGQDEIDLNLRVRVSKLEQSFLDLTKENGIKGVIDTIPGVKTLLIEYDPLELSLKYLLEMMIDIEHNLCEVMDLSKNEIILPSRIFNLPFVFNCEWTNGAIQRYMNEVRDAAAYLPSNTQFICNNNGLDGIEDLDRMIYDISFMVLGLGDVYLGAPCALPVDPRHRLNVPKYNPSRNYTPEGAVGIGGKFLCIYPMESPGGYQLIGRTLQIFDKDNNKKPWLLDMFDQIRFHPVSHSELTELRELNANGALEIDVVDSKFNLNEYNSFINQQSVKEEVDAFRANQKIFQSEQLKLDKYLSERGKIACQNILYFHAQMLINGPKYGVSLYLHIQQHSEKDQICISDDFYIKPLKEFSMTLYGKEHCVVLNKMIESEQESNKFDLIYSVNDEEYRVDDIVFDPENKDYVDWDARSKQCDQESSSNQENIDGNVECVRSDLPAKVVKLHVNIGDEVKVGDEIAVLSAMKMEVSVSAPANGYVAYINDREILNANDVIAHIAA